MYCQVYVYEHHMHSWYPWGSEESGAPPRTRVTDSCEPACQRNVNTWSRPLSHLPSPYNCLVTTEGNFTMEASGRYSPHY